MIEREEIKRILEKYDKITIATICSHSALQIFHGAKKEGFKTLGICKRENKEAYEAFPLGKPDEFLLVEEYKEVLEESFQEKLKDRKAIIIPHGSFVEYVKARNIEEKLRVPLFGNRKVLEWESNRKKEREWLELSDLKTPREFSHPSEIDKLTLIKFPGAKGGQGYFLAKNEQEFYQKVKEHHVKEEECTIQEYILGTRFYPHYFYSPLEKETELLSMDIRYESNLEGFSRLPYSFQKELQPSFVVTGNTPVIVRESLLPKILRMGQEVVKASQELFPPGLIGAFCLETICQENLEFITFEISARIVAGTNLYIQGSPYSCLKYKEPMSTGRRIAREIKNSLKRKVLDRIVY